jgi:hypothetical protein
VLEKETVVVRHVLKTVRLRDLHPLVVDVEEDIKCADGRASFGQR